MKAALFLVLAVVVGRFWSQRVFVYAARLQVSGALLAVCICFCFVVATPPGWWGWLRSWERSRRAWCSRKSIISRFWNAESAGGGAFVPDHDAGGSGFFCPDGIPRGSEELLFRAVLGFAALITLVAILGKQICGLGVLERGVDRLAIGVGMIPRGEVGLIFAGMGSTLMLRGPARPFADDFLGAGADDHADHIYHSAIVEGGV